MKIIIILFLAFCSCSSNSNVDKYLTDVGINLKDNYVLVTSDTNSAIGESSQSFDLKITENDFNIITSKLKLVKNYIELKENSLPNNVSEMSNIDKISAYKSGVKYFYNVEKADTNENYLVILTGKNNLSLTHQED